jgi:hypothetical protein
MGPDTFLETANTYRVVDQVLRWRGLNKDQIRRGWQKVEGDAIRGGKQVGSYSINEEVYGILVTMVQQGQVCEAEVNDEPLFEGMGNWGVRGDPTKPACLPHYNSCRLTAHGERIAQDLLSQHPEFRKKVTE